MPAHNAEKYIEEAIESVIRQSYKDWELIVVNDGSSDNTEKIVLKFIENESRIKLFNEENKNPAATRNVGIRNSTGGWIAFLDSDDIWLPEKLSVQYDYINKKPEIDVFFSDGYTRFEDINVQSYYNFYVAKNFVDGKAMYKTAFSCNPMPILSTIIKKEWVTKVGFQDESKIVFGSEDWDYCIRLALSGANFYGIEQRLFIYRVHPGGVSSKLLTQRLSSVMILIKNFRVELLDNKQILAFKREVLEVYRDLVVAGRISEANTCKNSLALLKGLDDKSLIKGLTSSLILFKWQRVANNSISKLKSFFKRSFLWIVRSFFFSAYRFFSKYSFNLNIQYHRWLLGKNLETRGNFYLHPTAKINGGDTPGKILTLGLSVNNYSQIDITSPQSNFTTGKDVKIGSYCTLNIEGKLSINTNVFFGNYCSVNCLNEITIGDNVWLGDGVKIYDHKYQFSDTKKPFTEKEFIKGKISIGRNVSIGSNTVILQNVTIGDNCVIGENKVIYNSIPPNTRL